MFTSHQGLKGKGYWKRATQWELGSPRDIATARVAQSY